jgi:hypothetical protein
VDFFRVELKPFGHPLNERGLAGPQLAVQANDSAAFKAAADFRTQPACQFCCNAVLTAVEGAVGKFYFDTHCVKS